MQKIFGYARVSSKEQNVGRQLEEFKKYNIDSRDTFVDYASGKDMDREQYQLMKRIIRENDVLVVKEMDRLGRSKEQIKEELEYYQGKNVRVIMLDIPTTQMDLSNMEEGIAKEMIKMVNNVLIEVLSTIAETERSKIRQRQAEGILLAKQEGKYKGRQPKKLNEWDSYIGKWEKGEISALQICRELNISSPTFYRRLNKEKK